MGTRCRVPSSAEIHRQLAVILPRELEKAESWWWEAGISTKKLVNCRKCHLAGGDLQHGAHDVSDHFVEGTVEDEIEAVPALPLVDDRDLQRGAKGMSSVMSTRRSFAWT